MTTTTDHIYTAGIIDGEGCISVWKNNGYHSLKLTIANTDQRLLNWLVKIWGGSVCGHKVKEGWKPVYHWSVYGLQAYLILTLCRPHMKVRDKQVDEVFRSKWMPAKSTHLSPEEKELRYDIYKNMKELNKRGK